MGQSLAEIFDDKYLTSNLRLKLLSEIRENLQVVQSRNNDNSIQLKIFRGYPGERFSISLELECDNYVITEDFII